MACAVVSTTGVTGRTTGQPAAGVGALAGPPIPGVRATAARANATQLFGSLVEEDADAIEGALATQLLGLHATAMRCLAEAVKATDSRCVDLYLNRVAKLLRTFSQQSEALNRHRGRGQQTVRVEHVHVNAGGQAIVGAVNAGGGGKHEK
jgi:hypothetical protein